MIDRAATGMGMWRNGLAGCLGTNGQLGVGTVVVDLISRTEYIYVVVLWMANGKCTINLLQ